MSIDPVSIIWALAITAFGFVLGRLCTVSRAEQSDFAYRIASDSAALTIREEQCKAKEAELDMREQAIVAMERGEHLCDCGCKG